MDVCRELLEHFETEGLNFLHNIITIDESWMHYYDPETEQQNSQWKGRQSPPPMKAETARSTGKVTMVIFFDHAGFIYQRTLPKKTTVTYDVYLQILKQFLYTFAKKHLQKCISDMLLHQDNARSHVACTVLDFPTSKVISNSFLTPVFT